MKAILTLGLCTAFCGMAFAAVDVAPHFGMGDNDRDVVGDYYEAGLGCWLEAGRFYNHFYLGYQKEFGIMEEYTVEHASAYRVGDTAAYVLHRGLPNVYVGVNVEYYEWRKFDWPGAGTDFWLPAFGVKIDWESFALLAENLGPYGYGFELGHGRWDNVTTARGFFRPYRHFGIYVACSCEWSSFESRIVEYRGNERYERELTEYYTGWFFGAGPAFTF